MLSYLHLLSRMTQRLLPQCCDANDFIGEQHDDWDPIKQAIIHNYYNKFKQLGIADQIPLIQRPFMNIEILAANSIKWQKKHLLAARAKEEYKKICKKVKQSINDSLYEVINNSYEERTHFQLNKCSTLPLPLELVTLVIGYKGSSEDDIFLAKESIVSIIGEYVVGNDEHVSGQESTIYSYLVNIEEF